VCAARRHGARVAFAVAQVLHDSAGERRRFAWRWRGVRHRKEYVIDPHGEVRIVPRSAVCAI